MTQPHQIDREAVVATVVWSEAVIDEHLAHLRRKGDDASCMVIEYLRRRPAPIEAVAWRVRTSCGEGGFLTDTYPHNGAALIKNGYTIQALALIATHPEPGT